MSVFDEIRAAAAEVARRARWVRIDPERLAALAEGFEGEPPERLDPAHRKRADERSTLAYVLTLDAVNFGSGWFPLLRKPPGLSGYFTIAGALERHLDAGGSLEAGELLALDTREVTRIFGQEEAPAELRGLMQRFRRALNDLGAFLLERYQGRFEGLVEDAGGRAERLLGLLAEMPYYRDVSRYGELEVPFYKRAQLSAADLAGAFRGSGWGRFEDLEELTIFADNLVPHVLRCEGVLVYAPELAARIDAGELLPAGSPQEVEIRALALHAVELCVGRLRASGRATSARELDQALWNRGQRPELKARPRHRTRSVYY